MKPRKKTVAVGDGTAVALHLLAVFIAIVILGVLGVLARPAPKPRAPMYLGEFVTAQNITTYAATVGCPGLLLRDGQDTVEEALHQIQRCLDKQKQPVIP